MSHFKEFPAYNFTSCSNRDNKTSVVFCVTGNKFTDGFVNNWTSFLFSFDYVKSFIEPHFVNHHCVNINDTRNQILCGEDLNNDYRNLFYRDWDYDLLFWIDSNLNYFDPNDLVNMIIKMRESRRIDVLTHKENNIENFDLRFTVFRNKIFERLKYPWFEENKNIDKLFNQKLVDMKLNIYFDQSVKIE